MRSLDHKNRRRAPHDDFVIIIVPELVKHLEPASQLQQVVGPVPASSSRWGRGWTCSHRVDCLRGTPGSWCEAPPPAPLTSAGGGVWFSKVRPVTAGGRFGGGSARPRDGRAARLPSGHASGSVSAFAGPGLCSWLRSFFSGGFSRLYFCCRGRRLLLFRVFPARGGSGIRCGGGAAVACPVPEACLEAVALRGDARSFWLSMP